MKRVLKLLPVYLLVLLACGYGIWQFVEENQVPEVFQEIVPTESTAFTPRPQYTGPELDYAGYLEWGESYTVSKAGVYTGTLEYTVDSVRIVTEESQCPPEEWFFSGGLGSMNLELGMMQPCPREEWFTEGGAFDQGCRLVVVDMTVKNLDAQAMHYSDPTVFHMGNALDLVDRNYTITTNITETAYQPYISMGFSLLNHFIPDELRSPQDPSIHMDSVEIQLPPGESVSFSLVFSVDQNDDGTAKDLSKLALQTDHSWVKDTYLIELTED